MEMHSGIRTDEEDELTREVKKAEFKIKDKKVVVIDGIPREIWKYGGEELEELVDLRY